MKKLIFTLILVFIFGDLSFAQNISQNELEKRFINPRPEANYKYLQKEGKTDVVAACIEATNKGYITDSNFQILPGLDGFATAVEMDPVAKANKTFFYNGKWYGFLNPQKNSHLRVQDTRSKKIYISGCGNEESDFLYVKIQSLPSDTGRKTYVWYSSAWQNWGSCVGGKKTRFRTVECFDGNGNLVSDSYCASLKPANSETIVCSTNQNDCCKDKPYLNSNGSTLSTYTQIQTTGSRNSTLTGNLGYDIRIIDDYYSNQVTQSFAQIPVCAQNVLGNQVFFNEFNANNNKLSGIKYSKKDYVSRSNFRYLKECATGKNYWQRNKGWIIPLGVGILGGTTVAIVSGTGSGNSSGNTGSYNPG